MSSVSLQTLYDLKTLHKETLYALLRVYLGVDVEIPHHLSPVLLGHRSFPIEYAPKDAAEKWSFFLFGIFYASRPQKGKGVFLIRMSDGSLLVPYQTELALDAYIAENQPLDDAVLMPYKQWVLTDEYQQRFGDWES